MRLLKSSSYIDTLLLTKPTMVHYGKQNFTSSQTKHTSLSQVEGRNQMTKVVFILVRIYLAFLLL